MRLRQYHERRRFTVAQRRELHRRIDAIESYLGHGAPVVPHEYPAIRAFLDCLRSIPDRICVHCAPFDYRITVQDACDRETIRDLRDMVDCAEFTRDDAESVPDVADS